MKKVLKLRCSSICECDGQQEKQFVKVTFQNYKDGYKDDGSEIFIYRRETPEYVFDYDEEEYFDCIDPPTEDELIFKGHLPDLNTFAEYDDKTAKVGHVYAYWVGKGEIGEAISGPVAIKMRDSRVWWSYEKINQKIDSLASRYSTVEVREIGRTPFDKPIKAVICGNRENIIACVGAVHAGESGPEILLTMLDEILGENINTFKDCGIAIVPVVNADMREEMVKGAPWYIRKNSRGVDLNRNFDADWELIDYSYGLSSADYKSPTYRGPYPNSEPETKALIKFVEAVKPKAVFSYHYLCSICTDRLISYGGAANDGCYIKSLKEIANVYSQAFRHTIGVKPANITKIDLICSAGSFIAWLYKRGIYAFDIEMNSDLEHLFNCRRDNSTKEALDLAINGHKASILNIINFF